MLGTLSMSPWFVVLTASQQELPTVWRLHLVGLEMFTPVLRRRIRTGRFRHGQAITRLVARPMFPSYGFVQKNPLLNLDAILRVDGVRDFLRNERDKPVTLPHQAVLAIFAKQQEEHLEFIEAHRRRRRFVGKMHLGDRVRVDDGGIYSGLVATIDAIDARGRIELLFGMIRHSLPAEMVVAA